MLDIKQNESLSNHTTFKIGGPAKFFIVVDSREKLVEAIEWAKRNGEPIFVIGWGSNILVSDEGFSGLVVKFFGNNIEFDGDEATVFAGADLGAFVRQAARAGLSGLEFAANIPGSVGGALRGNAGAYGKGVGDFVKKITALNVKTMEFVTLSVAECGFSYRNSLFKQKSDIIIVEAKFKLIVSDKSAEGLLSEIEAERASRKVKQPLEYPNAGCVFVNIEADKLSAEKREELGRFIVNNKIAAACLIDNCGLKGTKIGGAQVSEKHANFIINIGGAKATDVISLINLIKRTILEKFGVEMTEEIQYLGCENI